MQRLLLAKSLLLSLLLLALSSAALSGCSSNEVCDPGQPCECNGGHECYIGCEGDGCTPHCSQMNRCGAVCDDNCSSLCHDMDECSTSCGDDCDVKCHGAEACGAICGDRCHFDCHDVGRCGVRAGNQSEIVCHNFSRCDVECTGTCRVHSASPDICDPTGGCTLKCLGGAAQTMCSDGSVACGAC